MKNVRLIWVTILVSIFIAAVCFPAWGAKTIKIGVIGPMQFLQGKGHWNGASMAAEEINAQGGVKVGQQKMKKCYGCHQCHGTSDDESQSGFRCGWVQE